VILDLDSHLDPRHERALYPGRHQLAQCADRRVYPGVLLWPTAAVTIKRLHDRGKSGLWALLMILAWMLLAGNWSVLPGAWQWVVGRFVPTLIIVMMFIDLGAFVGTQGENKFGKDTQDVRWKAES
jgi:uncharacterized membrane protein YhaH (DUF805 family)